MTEKSVVLHTEGPDAEDPRSYEAALRHRAARDAGEPTRWSAIDGTPIDLSQQHHLVSVTPEGGEGE